MQGLQQQISKICLLQVLPTNFIIDWFCHAINLSRLSLCVVELFSSYLAVVQPIQMSGAEPVF